MTDLDHLAYFAYEHEAARGYVRDFVKVVTEWKIVRGVTLRPLPHWILLNYGADLLSPEFSVDGMPDRQRLTLDLLDRRAFEAVALAERGGLTPYFDLTVVPERWSEVVDRYFPNHPAARHAPLLLTAMVKTDRDDKYAEETLAKLRDLVGHWPLPAIVEPNHDGRLQLAAGDGILAGTANGVSGGFLRDSGNGKIFAVTCTHVAPLNSQVFDSAGNTVGTCAVATALIANPQDLACDPLAGSGAAPINNLDIALVPVTNVAATKLGYSSALRQGQTITVYRSGYVPRVFQIRSLVISFHFAHTHGGVTDRFCFRDLVELYSPNALTQASDSGAWGYTVGSDWAVMVVGGDAISSFAVRASHVIDWAGHAFGGSQRYFAVY